MIELYEKIDLKIKTQDKTSVYPVTVKLELNAEDKKMLDAFQKEIEEKYQPIIDATDRAKALSRQIKRLEEDIADMEEEIDETEDPEDRAALRKKRKALRSKLRAAEDELAQIESEYDLSAYAEAKENLTEEIARRSFEINVIDDEKREALENAIETYGIKYAVIVAEIGRLIQEAKRKKKRRS